MTTWRQRTMNTVPAPTVNDPDRNRIKVVPCVILMSPGTDNGLKNS